MSGLLDEILDAVDGLSPADRDELIRTAYEATKGDIWLPNPGPQTAAIECLADDLFYGGQAGGGKTDLLIGLALTDHRRSLLLRRVNNEVRGIEDRMQEIVGDDIGLNRTLHRWQRPEGRVVDMGGVQYEQDKQKYKGVPHDLIGFDEIADFTESQFRFIIAWNRSTDPGQRSRVVCTGNPPTTPEGLWVLKYWGPWLDPTHPNPARDGEIRYFTTIDDKDVECAGPDPIEVNGEMIKPRSRTFIRSKLSDNPDLAATDYDSNLAALPPELREAYRSGRFDVARPDADWQCIPTAWVKAAQERWREEPPEHVPMTCLSHDVALGGGDSNAWARRYGLWYAPIVVEKLSGNVDPADLAARNITLLRDGAALVIDMGGGYGSGVYSYVKANLPALHSAGLLFGHNGAHESKKRARDKKLKFRNKRAEVWWTFREALEPGLGENVALPPDPELLADLTAPSWKLGPSGIQIEPKEDIRKRLGRSPDKGDCVVNAWSYGENAVSTHWRVAVQSERSGQGPRVNTSHTRWKRTGR